MVKARKRCTKKQIRQGKCRTHVHITTGTGGPRRTGPVVGPLKPDKKPHPKPKPEPPKPHKKPHKKGPGFLKKIVTGGEKALVRGAKKFAKKFIEGEGPTRGKTKKEVPGATPGGHGPFQSALGPDHDAGPHYRMDDWTIDPGRAAERVRRFAHSTKKLLGPGGQWAVRHPDKIAKGIDYTFKHTTTPLLQGAADTVKSIPGAIVKGAKTIAKLEAIHHLIGGHSD